MSDNRNDIAPSGATTMYGATTTTRDEHWTYFDNSVNAVSFGFVATAVLICMFVVMAIFERFLRPPSPAAEPPELRRSTADVESHIAFSSKLGHPTPKIPTSDQGFLVLMPGEEMPTFIAHLAPHAMNGIKTED